MYERGTVYCCKHGIPELHAQHSEHLWRVIQLRGTEE
jgi:hypothetical protein